MGIVKKLGKPITGATRPQNRPQQIRQGGGTAAAQSQIAAPPQPFQNPRGSANFQRNRTNDAATQGLGDGRSRNSANIAGAQPMSDQESMRRAGYTKPVNYAGYKVDQVTQHRFDGALTTRGNRHASELTKARKVPRPLVKPMSNDDFLQGAKLYRREHGNL
jgi:hypothetical protein